MCICVAQIMALMDSPVTMDMMTCLAHICKVFSAEDHEVAKVRRFRIIMHPLASSV